MSKTYVNIEKKDDRLIVLIDMDCFYCQVEEKLNSELKDKPIAVVQYNAYKGGGIIAVNYAARNKGVTRHMRGDEAKEKCPEIELVRVPSVNGKADLAKYRDAGNEVAKVLQSYTTIFEKASVDEAFLDITDQVMEKKRLINQKKCSIEPSMLINTYAFGFPLIGDFVMNVSKFGTTDQDIEFEDQIFKNSDIKLLLAASIVNEIRAAVKEKTGYECSAGIAHNKILAKLVCGFNKPNKQTILPLSKIPLLLSTLPLNKIRGLGGKFGKTVSEKLKIQFVGDLLEFPEKELQKHFDSKNGSWLYLIARGIDLETVTPRFLSKSIGCCKNFPGKSAINDITTLNHWLNELAREIQVRLEKDELENKRKAKKMTVNYVQVINGNDTSISRTVGLNEYDCAYITNEALDAIKKNTDVFLKSGSTTILNNSLKHLGIYVGKFNEIVDIKKNSLLELFNNHVKRNSDKKFILDEDSNSSNSSNSFDAPETKTNKIKDLFNNQNLVEKNDKMMLDSKSLEHNIIEENKQKISFFNSIKKSEIIPGPSTSFVKHILIEKSELVASIHQDSSIIKEEEKYFKPIIDCNSNSDVPTLNEDFSKDYEKSYVEFYRPPNIDSLYEICKNCNLKVLQIEMQSHMDRHFAIDLKKQERYKLIDEIAKNMVKKPKSNSNVKTIDSFFVKTTSATTDNKSFSKENFTSNNEENMEETSNLDDDEAIEKLEQSLLSSLENCDIDNQAADMAIQSTSKANIFFQNSNSTVFNNNSENLFDICKTCNQKILLKEMQCHLDRHFAFDLSQQQRQEFQNSLIKKQKTNLNSNTPPAKVNKRKRTTSTSKMLTQNKINLISYFKKSIP